MHHHRIGTLYSSFYQCHQHLMQILRTYNNNNRINTSNEILYCDWSSTQGHVGVQHYYSYPITTFCNWIPVIGHNYYIAHASILSSFFAVRLLVSIR